MPRLIRLRPAAAALALTAAIIVGAGATPSASADVAIIDAPATCCVSARRIDPPEPARDAESVAVVGDSLTVGVVDDRFQSGPTLQAALQSRGVRVWVNADVSMSIGAGTDVVRSNGTEIAIAEVVVVALGTNDIVGTGDPDDLRRRIERLTAAVLASNDDAHVVWVDLAFPRFASRTSVFNDVLAGLAAAHPSLHHCRWSDRIATEPGWYAGDLVHLTSTGYAARRDTIIACIDMVDVAR